VLTSVAFLLRLLVLPLAVVEDPADRRNGVGVDFDEIEPGFASACHGVSEGYDPYVVSVGPYETDFARADPFVDPKLSENRLGPLANSLRHD
jgi:hypothetical protein